MLYIFGWMLVGSRFIKAPIATGKSTPVVGMLQQQTLPVVRCLHRPRSSLAYFVEIRIYPELIFLLLVKPGR